MDIGGKERVQQARVPELGVRSSIVIGGMTEIDVAVVGIRKLVSGQLIRSFLGVDGGTHNLSGGGGWAGVSGEMMLCVWERRIEDGEGR